MFSISSSSDEDKIYLIELLGKFNVILNVNHSLADSKHLITLQSPLIHLLSHIVPGYKLLIDKRHSEKPSAFEAGPHAYLEAAGKA